MTRAEPDHVARRALVSGTVQGVGFRVSVRTEARNLGVLGWVRNLDDGRVEVHAEGPAALVDALLTYCRVGPPAGVVTNVAVSDAVPEGAVVFAVR